MAANKFPGETIEMRGALAAAWYVLTLLAGWVVAAHGASVPATVHTIVPTECKNYFVWQSLGNGVIWNPGGAGRAAERAMHGVAVAAEAPTQPRPGSRLGTLPEP